MTTNDRHTTPTARNVVELFYAFQSARKRLKEAAPAIVRRENLLRYAFDLSGGTL